MPTEGYVNLHPLEDGRWWPPFMAELPTSDAGAAAEKDRPSYPADRTLRDVLQRHVGGGGAGEHQVATLVRTPFS
jgi:hypothetical protein